MKIFKLFINENIKIWKKFSTKLLIVVVILSLIGVLGLTKLIQKINSNNEVNISYNWRESAKQDIEFYKEQLKQEDLNSEDKLYFETEIEKYELYLQHDVQLYGNLWKSNIIEYMATEKINKNEAEVKKMEEILANDDYVAFRNIKKESIKKSYDNKEITEAEYKDNMLIWELETKYEIGKNENSDIWKASIIGEINQLQYSIRTGIDNQTRKVITAEQKQQNEEKIQIYMYRLEHNLPSLNQAMTTEKGYRLMFETLSPMFVIVVLSIVAIIIAGGTISTEVSSGTIKFWALTPNRRWKILTAKILSVIFYILVITLIMSILSIACANLFFEEQGDQYLYVKNGEVKAIGNSLYTIALYFAKAIPVIIFALFAIMLSTITRNTAVSVSVSVALYMGNSMFMAIINQFIKKDWIRFVPLNNLNISDKIFVNADNIMSMATQSFATSTSLQFSLAVLGVCVILMLITTYDSFNKRDII